jgi:thiamine pyrophosphokinase
MKKCIIIANGEAPKKRIFSFLKKKEYNTIISADGGASIALKLGLIPDIVIGDLDSIDKNAIDKLKNKSRIIKIKRQSDTDLEKAIKFAVKNRFTDAVVLSASGKRVDHSLVNFSLPIKFFNKIRLTILTNHSLLLPVKGDVKIKSVKGEVLSFFGFDDKTVVITGGLKYAMKNTNLHFGRNESISNVSSSETVELKVNGGIILVIRETGTVIKHDLL